MGYGDEFGGEGGRGWVVEEVAEALEWVVSIEDA